MTTDDRLQTTEHGRVTDHHLPSVIRHPSSVVRRLLSITCCLILAAPLSFAQNEEKEVEMSIPPNVQKSIDKGLAYLARTQMPDGSWPTKFGRTTGIVGCVHEGD